MLESDLRFSAYARCELLNSSADNPSLLKPYYPNLKDESLIKEAKSIASLFLELLNSVFVVKNLLTSTACLLAIIETLHANQAVLAESLNNPGHKERHKIHTATENTSDDVSNSNEGDVTNEASTSELEQLEANTHDGSTTKHNSVMNVLLQNDVRVNQQLLKEKKARLNKLQNKLKAIERADQKKMGECLSNSDLQNQLRETVASSKPLRDELKSQISVLLPEIVELEQLIIQIQGAEADLAKASKPKPRDKDYKRRCYGTAQSIGFYMEPTTKPSLTRTEDGLRASAVFTFNLQGRAIRLLYAAFNQQLELEQKEDPVSGSKGYALVTKPTDELYDCRVKINLYFPDQIVNRRWYGTFSEESSVPENFYPITAGSRMSIGSFLYVTIMRMSGVTPYALRRYFSRFAKADPNKAEEGNSTYSNALSTINDLILTPTIDSLLLIIQQSSSVNIYADEVNVQVNAVQGLGHIGKAALNKFLQGGYDDMSKTQYAMALHCECFQEDGSTINVVLMEYIGGRSSDRIHDFVLKVLDPSSSDCKVNFLYTDAYKAYKKLAEQLNCKWGVCLVHAYRKFIACFNGYFKLVEQVHKARTAEDRANYQAQLDNLLAYKEVHAGLAIMRFIQTILCLDSRVLDEVNEQFSANELGSLEYRNVLYEKRKACREDVIAPYFEKIEHYCNTYFAQFLNEEYSGTESFPATRGLCKAVKYLVNNWKQITSFTDTPEMYCNNNRCEQTIKKALLTRKMRCQNFQTEKEAQHFLNMQSVWQTLEANGIDPFEFFARVNHITLMCMVSLYLRKNIASGSKLSKRAMSSIDFKPQAIDNILYEDIIRSFLRDKHITDQKLYEHIAMVATTPFVKNDGVKIARFNKKNDLKRQATISPKLHQPAV